MLILYSIGMRLLILGGLIVWGVSSLASAPVADSSVSEVATSDAPSFVVEENIDPNITAKAYSVFDVETGEVLLSHNIDESLPIASITKLFTAAAVLQNESIDEEVTITAADVEAEGRAGKLVAGQVYKLRELLFPLLLESSNDAAAAFESQLDSIPFADKVLADASGLSAESKVSVSELSNEVRDLYLNMPQLFDITALKQYIGEETGWVNNSPVRDLVGYKGGKSGYTEAAGRTLVAIFTEPTLEDREVGYVILGSDDVRVDTEELRAMVESSVYLE